MDMPLPMSRPALIALIEKTAAMIEGPTVGFYLQVTRAPPRGRTAILTSKGLS